MAALSWPVLLDYAVSWAGSPASTPLQPYWTSIGERTEGRVHIRRGKVYELDQVQPGSVEGLTLRNDDGVFDPQNSSGPYYGQLVPYRLMRIRAQYPRTVNLLTQNQATAGEATATPAPVEQPWGAGVTPVWGVDLQSLATVTAADATAFQGANVFATPVPSSWTYGSAHSVLGMNGWSVAPGVQYTGSCYVRSSTASVTATVAVQIVWLNASGGVISSVQGTAASIAAGATAAWTRVSVTATAPANAAGAVMYVYPASGPATAWTLQSDGWQLEQGAAASTFATPGVWYPMFTGYIERWPQSWTSGGNYGTVTLTANDVFTFLANRGMDYSAYLQLLTLNPTFFYPLDDATGSTTVHDQTNKRQPAPIVTPIATTIIPVSPGSSVSVAAGSRGYVPLGISGTVAGTGSGPATAQSQYIDLSAAGKNPAGPATAGWTRVIGFQSLAAPAYAGNYGILFWMLPPVPQPNGILNVIVARGSYDGSGNFGNPEVAMYNNGTLVADATLPSANLNDGGFHMLAFGVSAGGTFGAWLDGVPMSLTTAAPGPGTMQALVAGGIDTVGANIYWGSMYGPSQYGPPAGALTFIAEIPSLLTNTQAAQLASAFRYAFSSSSGTAETSGARYSRLLSLLGYPGPSRVDTGASKSYGPAVDWQGGSSPTSTLAALQAIVDSEVGQHFVGADGALVFQARTARMNQTSTVTFGENNGEVAYSNAVIDFDPTRVANDITVSTPQGGQSAALSASRVTDSASISQYGQVAGTHTVNTTDATELTGIAQGLLWLQKQPLPRLEALPIELGPNVSVWPTLLGLDLGACATVNRRPSNAPASSITGFLEQIEWELGDDGTAVWTGQVGNRSRLSFLKLNDATYGVLDSAVALLGF